MRDESPSAHSQINKKAELRICIHSSLVTSVNKSKAKGQKQANEHLLNQDLVFLSRLKLILYSQLLLMR